MQILVLGAAGGVGRRVVDLAAEQGHGVRAGARTPPGGPPGVEPLVVDVRDAEAVRRAVDGVDAVLWCVGVTRGSGGDVGRVGLPHVVAAAEASGVRRVVTVSGAGVTLPGDRKGPGARLVSALTRRFAGDLVADKQGEHDALAASSLLWTEVRPPRLVNASPTGRWQLVEEAPGLAARPVSRADVAAAMLGLATSDEWLRRSPFLVGGRR